MTPNAATRATIDEYIADFPPNVQLVLQQVRATIHAAAPDAVEAIKYGIPTYVHEGNLVHFAAFSKHIGLYPSPSGTTHFKTELAPYKAGKGSVQFPLNEPMPLELIAQIVTFRLEEMRAATATKAQAKAQAKAKRSGKKRA